MEQVAGQISGAQNIINSLMTEMERLRTPDPATAPTEVDAPACLISWVSDDPAQYIYKPDKVNIGPFHQRGPSHWMEEEKKTKLLHGLLQQQQQYRKKLEGYLTEMEDLVCCAGRCYDGTFSGLMSVTFAQMLLLDGYYLYSLFPDITVVATTEPDVPVASIDTMVACDVVFLLENQIPFFVLEKIHELITGEADGDGSTTIVVGRVARHVEELVRLHGYSAFTLDPEHARPCHLLHLLYMYFRPTALITAEDVQLTVHSNGSTIAVRPARCREFPCHLHLHYRYFRPTAHDAAHNNTPVNGNATSGSGPTPPTPARWRAATYYYAAGVRLVKRELNGGGEARSILDVELTGSTLHVPCLMVDSNTFRMLRNMVALEQHNPGLGSHVTAYCLFISQIANTEKDVALLVTKGIIVHFLRSEDEVAKGLSKLCDDVILNVYNPKSNLGYLRPKYEELEELCRGGWRKSMAWLRHNKCNNYLMALAVVAAFIVFICTVEQSVFAALSYLFKDLKEK